MARQIGKLTPAKVRHASKPGLYGDGGGLYLNVGPTGGKSWLFRFMLNGRAREMGLGALNTVGLALARERAAAARLLRHDGIDPLENRRAEKMQKAAAAASAVTFRRAAESYIKAHRAAWRNEKHAWQWSATLETHVYPVIGDLSVAAVETGHVTRILTPIWASKAETATRIRGRIEAVLDYAKTHGWRTGDNPARWRGHLQNVLPARARVAKVEHHPALPWREIGTFMAELSKQEGAAALALRFTILTAARTSEVIGAPWSEVDLHDRGARDKDGKLIQMGRVWVVPSERMKAGKQHRVPLSDAAQGVLEEVAKLRQSAAPDAPLFPGGKPGKGLSNMAMLALLRRMGHADLTVHGFRSSFRDWAAETGQPDDIAEAALAHVVGDKTIAAYQRGDLLERRRRLMATWADFCSRPAPLEDAGTVVELRAADAA